jgi:hypothetical protein
VLVKGYIYTCNTGHQYSPFASLALTLFVPLFSANNAQHTFPADDFAISANPLD